MAKKDIKRNPAAETIADLILSNYDVQNAKDVNEALKDEFFSHFNKSFSLSRLSLKSYLKSPLGLPSVDFKSLIFIQKVIVT